MKRKRILSGMRPTGPLHVGHYWGALENWAKLQDEFECFYMVADWHALTSEWKEPGKIASFGRENVADWIAAGVDPNRSVIFVQSDVPQHCELHVILSCITPLGWLERVPTYKEQMKELEAKGVDNYAFLGYPVLQAADILLYKGDCVPVGEDQVAHLELVREIARRFNATFADVFPEPQPRLTKTPRILGTDRRKMSKSYGNDIQLSHDEATVRKRVSSMITDPLRPRRTDPGHPDDCNVYAFHGLLNAKERLPQIHADCKAGTLGCTDCKAEMGAKLLEHFKPIMEKRRELLARPKELDEIIAAGNGRARAVAAATMAEVREAVFKAPRSDGR